MDTTLTFVWHDCFVYSSQSCIIVFDFWCNPHKPYNLHHIDFKDFLLDNLHGSAYTESLPVYFLVSHHHKDHFTKKIFEFAKILPRVQYIISEDVERSVRYLLRSEGTYKGNLKVDPSTVYTLKPGETFEDSLLRVNAFGSTDIGNSYVVEVDGKRLFHAGDLNAWMWKDESTPQEVAEAILDYETKIDEIEKHFHSFDLVMFPVDARIGRDWWEGAFRFVHRFDVGLFVPMHFCLYNSDKEQIDFIHKATNFALYANSQQGKYCSLTEPYEQLIISRSNP